MSVFTPTSSNRPIYDNFTPAVALTGKSLEHWPATAQLDDTAPVRTELVRRRADYSAARPGLDLALCADAVLAVFEAGR